MQNEIQSRIERARRIMLEASGNPVTLPEDLCRQLLEDNRQHEKEFNQCLIQADMELSVVRRQDKPMAITLTYYPSFEYLGPRTTILYAAPFGVPSSTKDITLQYVQHMFGNKKTEKLFSNPLKRISKFFNSLRK